MKKIIFTLLIITVIFFNSSASFAQTSEEEEEALMNNYVRDEQKNRACNNKTLYAQEGFKMKESGMSNTSICNKLNQDYKIGDDNCWVLIKFIDGIRKDYSSMTSDEIYKGVRDMCIDKQRK